MHHSIFAAAFGAVTCIAPFATQATPSQTYQHVLLLEIDGMHQVDLANWLQNPADVWLKRIAQHATIFSNAFVPAPADTFSGMLAQATGASQKVTDVFSDNGYDRRLLPPGSNCLGQPGTQVGFDANPDKNVQLLDAGGTLGHPLTQIDPVKLPRRLTANGVCKPVYPHEELRTNTMFEVAHAAGLRTAWSDIHPADEVLNGPSGQGVDDLFTPELNSLIPGFHQDWRTSFTAISEYDDIKLKAVLNEIHGMDSTGRNIVGVPAIFGMNFLAIAIGQRLPASGPLDPPGLAGGYLDAKATPSNGLAMQFARVDHQIGRLYQALAAAKLLNSTLIIVTAKFGQSPIDPAARLYVPATSVAGTPGFGAAVLYDTIMIWLNPQTRTPAIIAQAKAFLQANAGALHTTQLLDPPALAQIFRNPLVDSRTPDFMAIGGPGVTHLSPTSLVGFGGFSDDDRRLALMVSVPGLQPSVNTSIVSTTQVGPTVLQALGLAPNALLGVQKEGTQPLPYVLGARR